MADKSTPCRVTRGIPNYLHHYDDGPSFNLCITQNDEETAGSIARIDAESSIKRRHDPVSMETMVDEGSKSTKRKDVIDSSISEASLPSIEKRRKVIDGSSVSKGKNVVEDVPSKAGEVLYLFHIRKRLKYAIQLSEIAHLCHSSIVWLIYAIEL